MSKILAILLLLVMLVLSMVSTTSIMAAELKVIIQIDNLTTNYTPDQYLNSLIRGDAADFKHFPDIRFANNATNNIVLASHEAYLLNGTFRDPTSDALQWFTNIETIIVDKVYSIIYYSPAETYPVYNMLYLQMIKSFEVIPQKN